MTVGHRSAERRAHRRAHGDQPVLRRREDVRELGLRTPRGEVPRGVDRRDEGRRRAHRAHPLPRRHAEPAAARRRPRRRDRAREAAARARARARARSIGSTPASRCASASATTAPASCSTTSSRAKRSTPTGSRPSSSSSARSARRTTSRSRSAADRPGAPYPNRVSTFRVICSICGSRPASPCAQSVDPDVTTVAPASFVYAPSTAWP